MRYAQNYEANRVKQHDILYQVRDGKSISDSPYAIFKRLIHHPKYRKYTHKWVVDTTETLEFYKRNLRITKILNS